MGRDARAERVGHGCDRGQDRDDEAAVEIREAGGHGGAHNQDRASGSGLIDVTPQSEDVQGDPLRLRGVRMATGLHDVKGQKGVDQGRDERAEVRSEHVPPEQVRRRGGERERDEDHEVVCGHRADETGEEPAGQVGQGLKVGRWNFAGAELTDHHERIAIRVGEAQYRTVAEDALARVPDHRRRHEQSQGEGYSERKTRPSSHGQLTGPRVSHSRSLVLSRGELYTTKRRHAPAAGGDVDHVVAGDAGHRSHRTRRRRRRDSCSP